MAIQDDNTILMKSDLKAYHEAIAPMLGGSFMLSTNVSDYYSTDEKIVGVWTNGKPLYQKVIVDTLPSAINTPKYVNIGASIDYVFILNSMLDNQDGFYIPIPSLEPISDSKQTRVAAANNLFTTAPNTLQFRTANSAHVGKTICVIVCYTKTTDAANSAILTPGCYDINRPDLWPANKEIFFGNGLYGYRAVYTIDRTISANSQYNSDPITTNVTYMLNQGGKVKSKTGGWYFVFGATSLADSIASGWWVDPSNSNTLKYYIENAKNSTQVFTDFDVWVTYTK